MFKKLFTPTCLVLALFLLCVPPAPQAAETVQKNATLQDFDGTWLMDAEKSKISTKEAANKLGELTGFKFTVNAKAGTIRMEWADHQPKTHKVTAAKGDGQQLACTLEGQKAEMLMEKVSGDELLVRDRDEALVFIKVK